MAKKILLLLLFSLLLIYPVSGITLTITPENPAAGDEITMRGTATPDELLYPSISFEKTTGAGNGKYDYRLYGIKIPQGENNFAVTAQNVKNLNVRVKILLWWTKSADAASGIAKVSQGNVPSGTYEIRIDGDAVDGASSVPLTIKASTKIAADAQGNFEYRYSTSGIPPGTFTLSIGGITRTITLREISVPTSSSSGGGGGGDGDISDIEPYDNIVRVEKTYRNLIADILAIYNFSVPEHGLYEILVTGKENEYDVPIRVEALKGTSRLVTASAPGVVYKNMNIRAGTKKIKEVLIRFKVENSWITSNDMVSSDVKMFKWDGSKWMQLNTYEKTKDATHTYYEAKTDAFSSFAISGSKGAEAPTQTAAPVITVTGTTTPEPTAAVTPPVMYGSATTRYALIAYVFIAIVIITGAWYFFVIKKRE